MLNNKPVENSGITGKFSFVDLFSGPGGLSLGFKLSDFFEPVGAVESNPIAATTYSNNLQVEVLQKTIQHVTAVELCAIAKRKGFNSIDAVVGGPPCRPFTTANKGGTRWEKIKQKNGGVTEHPDWLNFWKIIDSFDPKPRFVVVENVMTIKDHDDVFMKFLDRLNSNYKVVTGVFHADDFGVPQSRKRLFIVGVKGFEGDEKQILNLEQEKSKTKKVVVEDAIGDLPKLSNENNLSIYKYNRGRPSGYQVLMRNKKGFVYDHIVHSVHPIMAERFKYIPQGYNLKKTWIEGKIPQKLMESTYYSQGKWHTFSQNTLENMHANIYRRLRWDDVSCTITHVRKTVLIHPLQDRLLSVREAARLQSFPDWYRFSGSISQQYQQIADAVPPFLAKAIACHLGELFLNPAFEPQIIRQ